MIFKSESSSELLLALSYCNNQKELTHISSHLQFHYSYHFHPYLRLPTLTSAPVIPESEQMQKSTKYSPLDSEQIRHEYRSCDRSQLHFFQFCGNAAHTITAFAQTKSALHFDSIDSILVLLFFSACAVAFGLPSFGPDNRIPCSLQ